MKKLNTRKKTYQHEVYDFRLKCVFAIPLCDWLLPSIPNMSYVALALLLSTPMPSLAILR